jgi:hypothetical protein
MLNHKTGYNNACLIKKRLPSTNNKENKKRNRKMREEDYIFQMVAIKNIEIGKFFFFGGD